MTPLVYTKDIDGLFFAKLDQVASDLWTHPVDLLAVMYSESGVKASAWNDNPKTLPPEKRWNAVGLNQLMPATLTGLGFAGGYQSFLRLNATEQLDWVRKYFMPYRGKLVSIGAIYTANFLPALIDHAGDPSFVLTAAKGPLPWAFAPNASFDANGDLAITVAELQTAVQRNARGPRWAELLARLDVPDVVADPQPEGIDLGTTLGIQRALEQLGYAPGTCDGLPGPKTRSALVAFQTHEQLQADGIFGPRSRAAMTAALAAHV